MVKLAQRVRGELPVLGTSRTGQLIAGFGFDRDAAFTFVTVYDRQGRVVTPRRQLTNAFRVRDVQLADDGRALALRSDAGWELFNLQTGDRLRQIGRTPITSASISPDGTRFAVATPRAIVFVDVATLGAAARHPRAGTERGVARPGAGRLMRASTLLVVGFAGVVAVAAVVSGIRGSGDDDSPAATTVATTTASTSAAPATTAAGFPVGDLRRLAPPDCRGIRW